MGTRGSYGFYKNGMTKATYNHYDSYPEGLGKDVVNFIKTTSIKELNKIFENLKIVNQDSEPTEEEIKKLKKWSDQSVSTGQLTEWYVLLRNTQGNLGAFKEGLEYMIDGKDFLEDSLFCEWAFLINLDDNVLEVYEGFNQDPEEQGRYRCENSRNGYFAVKLVETFPLDNIPNDWKERVYEKYRHAIKPGYETEIYEQVDGGWSLRGTVQVQEMEIKDGVTKNIIYKFIKDEKERDIHTEKTYKVTKKEFEAMI